MSIVNRTTLKEQSGACQRIYLPCATVQNLCLLCELRLQKYPIYEEKLTLKIKLAL